VACNVVDVDVVFGYEIQCKIQLVLLWKPV
jgi:hypothetical protein